MFSTAEPEFDRTSSLRRSSRTSTAEGFQDGTLSPRSSLDHSRQLGEASSSRRPSSSSIHRSPTSVSSSYRQRAGHQKSENPRVANGEMHGFQSPRIPRITTSNADLRKGEERDDDGPQSAPAQGPDRSLSNNYDNLGGIHRPSRSVSSPEPGSSQNYKSSQPYSLTEHRINATAGPSGPPILGSPYTVHSQSWSNTSNLPPHPAVTHISSHNDLQDRAVESRISRSSLSESTSGTETPVQVFDAPTIVGDTTTTPRTARRGDPTYCGQCGQSVHGQFVRAMSKVFHLDCFRCQVSLSPQPDAPLTIHVGLQQSRGAKVLSCRGYDRHLPSLRKGLLRPA